MGLCPVKPTECVVGGVLEDVAVWDMTRRTRKTLPIRTQQSPQTNGFRGRGGQPNGAPSRGRGGTPRGTRPGYTKIDLKNDDGVVQNNPSFQLRSYNNAPPPADLDTRGRGRGRGGSRGGGPSRGVVPQGRRVPRGKGTAVVVPQQ